MLRLLHMADVHLGARHPDLGVEAASAQRERQFAAFVAACDAAIEEHVDVVLIAGDLFDSNTQSGHTVARVVAQLRRVVDAGARVVIIPGAHDAYDPTSLYRTYDFPAMAGLRPESDALVVFTPGRASVVYASLEVAVHGRVGIAGRENASPLAGFRAGATDGVRWRIGLVHAPLRAGDDGAASEAEPAARDDGAISEDEIGESGLDYLALGHLHAYRQGVRGTTSWAYPGPPELVDVAHDGAGQVLVVELSDDDGTRRVRHRPRATGTTRYAAVDLEAGDLAGTEGGGQDAIVERLRALASPDLVCDARLVGPRPDWLRVDEAQLAETLGPLFLRFRFRDESLPSLPPEPLPPQDSIAGAFLRDMVARIEAAEGEGRDAEAAEDREMLLVGRRILDPQLDAAP